MQLAVIGWGSLIWNAGNLPLRSRWRNDGPMLPVEYARKSKDKRLTLVLVSGVARQRTYWALGSHELDRARDELRVREGMGNVERVHWTTIQDGHDATDVNAVLIRKWLLGRPELDAVIWTGLPPNLDGDVTSAAVDYLCHLRGPDLDAARDYVRKTPAQIQTVVRAHMRGLGWTDEVLSADLFHAAY